MHLRRKSKPLMVFAPSNASKCLKNYQLIVLIIDFNWLILPRTSSNLNFPLLSVEPSWPRPLTTRQPLMLPSTASKPAQKICKYSVVIISIWFRCLQFCHEKGGIKAVFIVNTTELALRAVREKQEKRLNWGQFVASDTLGFATLCATLHRIFFSVAMQQRHAFPRWRTTEALIRPRLAALWRASSFF